MSGSWGFLFHPFLLGQPPQQQFLYNQPHRNIAQEQFLYFPHLRNPIPSPYQAYNYFPAERNPYNFYNPPTAARYPLYPNYRESYNPVVQYIYQQAPLQPVPSYTGYGEKVPKPVSKDCDDTIEIRVEPEVASKVPEAVIMEQLPKEPSADLMGDQPVEMMGEKMATSLMTEQPDETINLRISEEVEISPMSEQPMETSSGQISEETTASLMSAKPKEITSENLSEGVSANPASEQPQETVSVQMPTEDTANAMSFVSEAQSMDPAQQQEAEVVVVQSVEVPEADAMPMENSPAASTTVA